MPSLVALKVNGVSVEVAPGTTVAVAAMQAGQALPHLRDRNTARATVRNGYLLRVSHDDQWNIALPHLPDPVRIGNGSDYHEH